MAHDPESVMAGLVAKLAAASSFNTAVGGRIYRTLAPPDETEPLLVITRVVDAPWVHFAGSDIQLGLQFDLYGAKGASETALWATQKLLLDALEGASITITNAVGGTLEWDERGVSETDDQRVRIRSGGTLYATSTV